MPLVSTFNAVRILFFLLLFFPFHGLFAQNDGAPPFTFPVDTVIFSNGQIRLTGALLTPNGNGPFPAVVIVHGAGQSTLGEPAFRVHANAFVRSGFAVLVYDKRGSGSSTGDLDLADYDDLAEDLAAGVRYLRSRQDIIPDAIGVLGRSEGGWVAALAASHDPLLAFVIISSGTAIRPSEQVRYSTLTALQRMGAAPHDAEGAMAAKSAQWEFYRKAAEMDTIQRGSTAVRAEHNALLQRLRSYARFAPQVPQNLRDPSVTPTAFFRAFTRRIEFDPLPSFRSLHTPVLVIVGAQDQVVDPGRTQEQLERLRQEGCRIDVRILPDVDHSLLLFTPQGPRYPEGYPEFTAEWARSQTGRKNRQENR